MEQSAETAAELGFDAIELFLPGPEAVSPERLSRLLERTGLKLAMWHSLLLFATYNGQLPGGWLRQCPGMELPRLPHQPVDLPTAR